MASKKKYYSRKFLNKDRGMACIESDGEVSQADYDRGAPYLSVSITDCSRKISLDFNSRSVKENLYKFDVLINELIRVREWYKCAVGVSDAD